MDPLLGVFTGLFAYYLFENNPRTAPPENERLLELLKWKRAKSQGGRQQDGGEDEAIDWQKIAKELEKK